MSIYGYTTYNDALNYITSYNKIDLHCRLQDLDPECHFYTNDGMRTTDINPVPAYTRAILTDISVDDAVFLIKSFSDIYFAFSPKLCVNILLVPFSSWDWSCIDVEVRNAEVAKVLDSERLLFDKRMFLFDKP